MSLELVNNAVIKVEYMAGESDVDSNTLLFAKESRTKCGEVFLNHSGVNFTFVCALCLQPFSNLRNFGEHIRNVHLLPKDRTLAADAQHENVKPPKSELSEEAASDYKLHNMEEDEDTESLGITDPMELEENDPLLYVETSLKKKINSEKSTEPKHTKTLCCFSCGKIFLGSLPYRKHYRAEHPDMIEKDETIGTGLRKKHAFVPKAPNEMLCKFCLKTFHDPSTYHNHIVFDHADKIYSCPHCPTTFTKPHSRDYHVDAHEGKKRFQCPHCPMAFTDPSNLRTHINIHLNNKKYSCRFCGQKYVRMSDLRIHERIHTKEKPYQCDECGMSFIAQVKLTNHIRRHKNIKNYKCPHCEKAFFDSRVLKAHIVTHTTESPFGCDICDQKFRALSSLRSHKLLHSDKKTFACKVCGKMFAQHAGLYSHMKSHGGVK